MARRVHHEDHVNHEAWAIPYGDLITLLLAFFVVMYAISSVNEGKYRVAADAITTAFGGPPKTLDPIQIGEQATGADYDRPSPIQLGDRAGSAMTSSAEGERTMETLAGKVQGRQPIDPIEALKLQEAAEQAEAQLNAIQTQVERALGSLIMQDQVTVTRQGLWIEVNMRADVLFASGSAALGGGAVDTIGQLGQVLRELPNDVRVEGHTDNVPIRSAIYPSNWELSAARAASVVTLLEGRGVDPRRLQVVGYADKRPLQDNASEAGRNANRRVMLIILATPTEPVNPSTLQGSPAAVRAPATRPAAAVSGTSPLQAIDPAQALALPLQGQEIDGAAVDTQATNREEDGG